LPVIVWGAVAVSAFFHILATLGASLRVGRLSVVPTYDDVSYLVDGLHRLKAFDVAGFRGLFRSLAIEPAHDRPTPTCLGAQSRVRHKLNSQFAPEKPAEIGSKMPKALIVDGIHPKSCRCHAPLLFTSGN